MIEMLTNLLKDLKVLVGISAVLNVALVGVILHGAEDVHVKVGDIQVVLRTLTIQEHSKALFHEATQRSQVRVLMAQEHFFEIDPGHEDTESIVRALMNLADRHPPHALILKLRDMSRGLTGPFKSIERAAEIVTKNDQALSKGIAQVCRGSGFEDMYLTIWRTGHQYGQVTVHAEKQRHCTDEKRGVVALHIDDWKTLFDETDDSVQRSVIVELHPPRVDTRPKKVADLTIPIN
ncbi:MAG: hypothetical protein ACKVQT_30085 [Burkholderiales bacterium]